jgi:hypothetical protein
MKTRLILAVASGAVALAIIGFLAFSAYWQSKQGSFVDAPKIMSAVHQFSRDQVARGLQVGPEISLQDLIRGGYLTTNEVRAFDGMEVAFTPQTDDSNPEMVIARARMPDGKVNCLLSDGSVQQMSRQKFEQLRSPDGQPNAAANRSQPIRTETNQAPAAAGSGR